MAGVKPASSNVEAARSGDQRLALVKLRDTLAEAIDTASDRGDGTVAQLAAQYRGALAEIRALDALAEPEEVSELDRIRARREDRDGVPADRPRTTGRRKSGNG